MTAPILPHPDPARPDRTGPGPASRAAVAPIPDGTASPLRIATYNIRKAMGTDRRRDPARILQVIAGLGADVVLLQEADFRLPPRPPAIDPSEIERRTGLVPVAFGHGRASLGWHGNALLIRPGMRLIRAGHHDLPGLEPRGFVEAELERAGQRLRVMGVHLGLLRSSRRNQLTALNGLLGPQDRLSVPTLIAGDFNERSLEVGLGRLARRFRILDGGATYHSRFPLFALDRIAMTEEFHPERIEAFRSPEARLASDHLPLVAELRLRAALAQAATGTPGEGGTAGPESDGAERDPR
ncbi:endonuclease/exonuclease/phosphatase family protein [Pseudogemmobacter sonorensis]|uniref:endonuclease/exonuclease/phosphatase family protein n=1 Tax=Pseudogemmobacter sonorensis TaxID=2989681 RepID=UPI0036ABE988